MVCNGCLPHIEDFLAPYLTLTTAKLGEQFRIKHTIARQTRISNCQTFELFFYSVKAFFLYRFVFLGFLRKDTLNISGRPTQLLDCKRFYRFVLLYGAEKYITSTTFECDATLGRITLQLRTSFVNIPRCINFRYIPRVSFEAMMKPFFDCFLRARLSFCHSPAQGGENIDIVH